MKMYVHEHGIIIVGKAWEIRAKLKECSEQHYYLNQYLAKSSAITGDKNGTVIPFRSMQ